MVKQTCRHNTTDEECQLVVRGSHMLLVSFFLFPNCILALLLLTLSLLADFAVGANKDQSSPKNLIGNGKLTHVYTVHRTL